MPSAAPQRGRPNRLPFLLLILLGVIILAALPMLLGEIEYARTKKRFNMLKESMPELNLKTLSKAFTLVYRKVRPTVVHIDTHREFRPAAAIRLAVYWAGSLDRSSSRERRRDLLLTRLVT